MFGGQMRKPVRWNYLGVLTLRNCRSNSNAIPICSFSNPQVCWDVCRNTIHNKSLIQFDHICWWNPQVLVTSHEQNHRKLRLLLLFDQGVQPLQAMLLLQLLRTDVPRRGQLRLVIFQHRNGYQTDIICDFNKETLKKIWQEHPRGYVVIFVDMIFILEKIKVVLYPSCRVNTLSWLIAKSLAQECL